MCDNRFYSQEIFQIFHRRRKSYFLDFIGNIAIHDGRQDYSIYRELPTTCYKSPVWKIIIDLRFSTQKAESNIWHRIERTAATRKNCTIRHLKLTDFCLHWMGWHLILNFHSIWPAHFFKKQLQNYLAI